MIYVEKFVVNPLRENSYLLYDDTGGCIIVDAGFYYDEELEELDEYLQSKSLKPLRLVNTHCHFDHLMGIERLREKYNLEFVCHPEDVFLIERSVLQAELFGFSMKKTGPPDGFLEEGQQVAFGNSSLEVIHVPGHSPGHVVLYSALDGFLMAGDVLFYGSIGRTDLPGGDFDTLVTGIQKKLLVLPPDTKVYSGHGPETTIGFESMHNPFLS